jgi:hypothetical protein
MDTQETRLRLVEIETAVLRNKVDSLTMALNANTEAMDKLTEAVSKGKGAWVAFAAVAGVLAFIINLVATFFNKG